MSAVTTGTKSLMKVSRGFTILLIVKTVRRYLPQIISVNPENSYCLPRLNSEKLRLIHEGLVTPSQVPRPSCEEGRENEGPIRGEFSFHGRLWQKCSLKAENSAHNWNLPHVNSLPLPDEPGTSPPGAAAQPPLSPPPAR